MDEVAAAIEELHISNRADPRELAVWGALEELDGKKAPGVVGGASERESVLWDCDVGADSASGPTTSTGEESKRARLGAVYTTLRADVEREMPEGGWPEVPIRMPVVDLLCRIAKVRTLDESQEEAVQSAVDYVVAEAVAGETARPKAPLLLVRAGPGAGESGTAAEIRDRLSPIFGSNVVVCIAPTGVAASACYKGRRVTTPWG